MYDSTVRDSKKKKKKCKPECLIIQINYNYTDNYTDKQWYSHTFFEYVYMEEELSEFQLHA